MKILRGIPNTLSLAIQGDAGPLTLTTPVVTVLDPDGNTVATGAATGVAPAYTFALAPVTRLGVYTVTLAGTIAGAAVSHSEPLSVVGGYLFTLADFRGFDSALSDTTRYPDAQVRAVRDYVDQEFYMATLASLYPSATVDTVTVEADGRFYLSQPRPLDIVTATVDGTVEDPSMFIIDVAGAGYYTGSVAVMNPNNIWAGIMPGSSSVLTMEYEYGLAIVPPDVKRAALLRARAVINDNNTGIPDRAVSFVAAEGGNFTLATAGRSGYETGMPEVDAILARYRVKPPGVA